MKRLAIIGSGDLGQLIAHHASNDKQYEVMGFFDDYRQKGDKTGNVHVLGKIADVINCFEKKMFDEIMIGIGYKHISFRKKVFEELKGHVPYGRVIHSSSYVDSSCSIGEGVFILPGCVLDLNVHLKENVLLNTACVIAHDSKVEAHTFLSPAVKVAGFVKIGECCNIGINTTIIDNISIASGVQTGGGTVVKENLESPGLYVGNPSRFIR
jgi:sugar O-acyltransferase (sialic acid O-acetyltransferase NeuD family)